MQSLAFLVALLFFSSLLCGPIALIITRIHPVSRNREIAKKIAVGLLTMWGSLTGVNFIFALSGTVPRMLGIFAVGTSLWAVKREFGAPPKLKEE